jgi:hypothetical protein
MSCNCNKSVLPLVDEDQLRVNPSAAAPCCEDANALSSDTSDGATVDSWATVSVCATENVTLLGRIGNVCARLVGTGFIKITDGKASIVSSIPIRVRDMWHEWWRPARGRNPVPGVPKDFPYAVIADSAGDLHAIKGDPDADSVQVWNSSLNVFETLPVSAFPKKQRGLLPRAAALEIVGLAAIPENGSTTAVRDFSTLSGSGILVITQQDTVPSNCACPGCDPEASVASVATFLANPVGAGPFTLKFSADDGHYWSEDP